MKDKHTPGPGHQDESGHSCAGPQIIGKAYQFELDDSDYDELPCIPNARLMAAAPEMLEMIKEMTELLYEIGERLDNELVSETLMRIVKKSRAYVELF